MESQCFDKIPQSLTVCAFNDLRNSVRAGHKSFSKKLVTKRYKMKGKLFQNRRMIREHKSLSDSKKKRVLTK